jgi:hypothetical protein
LTGADSFNKYFQFNYQAAGHVGTLLKNDKDTILKPITPTELQFYEKIYNMLPDIQQFVPKYFGTHKRNSISIQTLTLFADYSIITRVLIKH